jgi:biofilm protein TabA
LVLDHLSQAPLYEGLSPSLARALRLLAATDWSACPTGRIEFEGDDLFATVSDYRTRPSSDVPWEAHRRYIDVQYVHAGGERIGHTTLHELTLHGYDAARDLVTADGEGTFFTLHAGHFAILWPHDAHRPGIAIGDPLDVRKVVLKVAVTYPTSASTV